MVLSDIGMVRPGMGKDQSLVGFVPFGEIFSDRIYRIMQN
jgi:hypothetical protein